MERLQRLMTVDIPFEGAELTNSYHDKMLVMWIQASRQTDHGSLHRIVNGLLVLVPGRSYQVLGTGRT